MITRLLSKFGFKRCEYCNKWFKPSGKRQRFHEECALLRLAEYLGWKE